jgi:hypothetical protein
VPAWTMLVRVHAHAIEALTSRDLPADHDRRDSRQSDVGTIDRSGQHRGVTFNDRWRETFDDRWRGSLCTLVVVTHRCLSAMGVVSPQIALRGRLCLRGSHDYHCTVE